MSVIYQAVTKIARLFGYYGAADIYRAPTISGGKRAAPTLNQSAVTMAIILPTREPDRRLMQQIGGERSRKMGYAAAGTDIKDGDEIRTSTTTYVVDGAESTPHMVICALSEIHP